MRLLDGITDLMDMSLGKLGVGVGQGGLACCSSWGRKELDMTERLNSTELMGIWSRWQGIGSGQHGTISQNTQMKT